MPGLSWLWAMVTGGEADGDDTSDPRLDGLDVRTIDVYDQAAVKRTLDEAISDLLTKDFGYTENNATGNTRLAIMAAAVGIGLLGQFWPGGFPDGSAGILCCAIAYFILSNVLSLYQILVEGDCIFTSLAAGGDELPIRVRSGMVKHEPRYVVVMEKTDLPAGKAVGSPTSVVDALLEQAFALVGLSPQGLGSVTEVSRPGEFVMFQADYGEFFTRKGHLVRSTLRAKVANLLARSDWLPAAQRSRNQAAAKKIQGAFRTARAGGKFEGDLPSDD